MAKNTIAAGRKVRFDPFETVYGYGIGDCRALVTGTIVKVYPKHKWFSVVYGDKQRISFKFCDLVSGRVMFVG